MSNRYKGGVISATPPTLVAGAGASGTWTLEQQMQANAAGLWPVNGPFYIEEVFSTWLYTGNGTGQTITNGIDLAGKGGLVWCKQRSGTAYSHALYDTARGARNILFSNLTDAQNNLVSGYGLTSFNSTGFSLGLDYFENAASQTYASWTFREQPKFFDVVTYTGNGTAGRTVAHNLGAVPGCIIVKRTDTTSNWSVYHRSLGNNQIVYLNLTDAAAVNTNWNNTTPTDTVFTVSDFSAVNASGGTYVAYLFAHNAGGFGLTGTDNVITCGSYTGNGGLNEINLGFEAQWVLVKSTGVENWMLYDNMRGMANSSTGSAQLFANLSNAEQSGLSRIYATATGFGMNTSSSQINTNGQAYIYIAIRRGPMKVPTTGTSVFTPIQWSGSHSQTLTPGFPTDLVVQNTSINTTPSAFYWGSRLQGGTAFLASNSSSAEGSFNSWQFDRATGTFTQSLTTGTLGVSIDYFMRRAPSFFDVVCYTGSGTTTTQTHNLQAVPELIFAKRRSGGAADWFVYSAVLGRNSYAFLNTNTQFQSDPGNAWGTTDPTTTTFSLSPITETNASGSTYVAYLFASAPGVSKVGSYTGTGATQLINCGFAAGARFVLIKATSTTGNWLVWDTARGMIPSNDPYLALNSGATQVTDTDWVDTAATGFELSNAGGNLANSNGVSYIFLAIA